MGVNFVFRDAEAIFPLSVSSNSRYLQTADGAPFLMVGDTVWSLSANATRTQITQILNDRAAKGCTAMLFSAPERAYTNQTPSYRNVNGDDPFTSHGSGTTNWVLNEDYWNEVDYIVNQCLALGIVCMMNPAYHGYGSGGDGWAAELGAASDATLQAYGAALATRYTQGNVVWCLGGDSPIDANTSDYGTAAGRTKQWQIVVGMRTVRTNDLITFHTARLTEGGAYNGAAAKSVNGTYPGFNINNIYTSLGTADAPGAADTEYGRSPTRPFFLIEAAYQGTSGDDEAMRVACVQNVMRGGIGGFFGAHDALWALGGAGSPDTRGPTAVLSDYLAGSWNSLGYLGNLLRSYSWWKLEPKTDNTLVSTAKGIGSGTICPALASDGTFGMVWTPGTNITVVMSALAPSSVRARWWDPTTGGFTTASGSPFANTGSQAFTAPGSRVLVLDAA